MSRPVWTGSLEFGPMHVPVRLYGAVSARQVQFHLLHDADGARIQQKRVCSADGEEVPYEQVVKGYEIRRGQYVALTRGELEAFEPEASRSIALENFVELSEIDPILFDTTYHLMPGEKAWRPYATVAMALRAAGRVGLGRLVMHQKGHLCAVWPYGRGLVLSTLHYADELIPQDSFSEFSPPAFRPLESEVESVLRVIETHAVAFEPLRYHDVYRERLLAFLERRARKQGLREVPPSPEVVSEEGRELATRGALRLHQQAAREVRKRTPRGGTRKPAGASTTARTRRKKKGSGAGK
jgi:DNA end-binding protein Ku